MSHKGGQPDPVKSDTVESIVGKFRKNVPGTEGSFLGTSRMGADEGYMYMTDGGEECIPYTTKLAEKDRQPSRSDNQTNVKDYSKGGSDKNG